MDKGTVVFKHTWNIGAELTGEMLGIVSEPGIHDRLVGYPPDEAEQMVFVRWYPGGTTPARWEYADELTVFTNQKRVG